MGRRQDLHQKLKEIATNVYFQPPENVQMAYPAIVYKRDAAKTEFADNNPYQHMTRYMVTVIDKDPDSPIRDKVAKLPRCIFSRHYAADKLNHDSYSIYF